MDKRIHLSKQGRITLIKVAAIFLLTVVCFIFGLAASISNSGNAVMAFNQNKVAAEPSATTTPSEAASLPAEASTPSPVAGEAQSPSPAPSKAAEKAGLEPTADKSLLPLAKINTLYKQFGSMIVEGMKPEDYDKAMAIEWQPLDTSGAPANYTIDLAELMDYSAAEKYILNLDRFEGVEVSVIGKSEQGRNIYMINADLVDEDAPAADKPVIMLTGNVHAREFAGAEYAIKFLNDTLQKAENDEYTRMLLESVTIVAVPLVNPDGREMIINGDSRSRKSNANGVDLNRAMPSVNAGQLANGVRRVREFSKKPGLAYFAGYNLGSESETQAMIKWFNYYVPKADLYIDLHQQGGIEYYNKGFLSNESDELSKAYAVLNNELLNHGYHLSREKKTYGLNGSGGTLTDYAKSVAEGMKYSYSLGRMVLDMGGVEMPLICFRDIDKYKEYYKPLNASFISISIEIGRSPGYLGASEKARQRRKNEYNRYGWDSFLTGTIENILGKEKTESLKAKASGL